VKIYVFTREKGKIYDLVTKQIINSPLELSLVDDVLNCDIVITIGGDGTILEVAKEAAELEKPLLGINTGRLGFMANLETSELTSPHETDWLQRLKNSDYSISVRMLLNVMVDNKNYTALNDVVLHREATSRLPEFAVFRGNHEVLKLRADGMIVTSPTGSTAYSLSAGGPIIQPELECFMVTAVCPHTLFNRPMIFPTNTPLYVRTKNVSAIVDGYVVAELTVESDITVLKSDACLKLIDIDGNSFYNSIHNKLMRPLK